MIKMDRWMLERVFEPAAREIESWLGIVPTRLARFCILVTVVADATKAIQEPAPLPYTILGASLFWAATLMILSFAAEHESKRATGTANFLKHDMMWSLLRTINIVLIGTNMAAYIVFLILPSLWGISSLFAALALAFASCDRLPPREKHVWSFGWLMRGA